MISSKLKLSLLLSAKTLAKALVIKDDTIQPVRNISDSPIVVKESVFEVDLKKDASPVVKELLQQEVFNYLRLRSDYESFMKKLDSRISNITESSFTRDTDMIDNGIVFNRNYHLLSDTTEVFNYSLISEKSNSFTELYKIVGDLAKKLNPELAQLFVKSAFVAKAVENISLLTQNPEAVLPFTSYANIYVDLLTSLTGTSKINEISYIMQVLIRIEEQNKKVLSLYKSLKKENDVYVESEIVELLNNVQLVSRLCTIFKSTSLNVLQNVLVQEKSYSVFLNAINLMHYFSNLCNFTNCAIAHLINELADENYLTYVSKLCNSMVDLYKNNLYFSIRKNSLDLFLDSINQPYSYLRSVVMFFLKFFIYPKFDESDVFLNCTGKYNDVYTEQMAFFSADSITSFVEEFETAYSEDLKKSILPGEIKKIMSEILPEIDEVEKRFITETNDKVEKVEVTTTSKKFNFVHLSLKAIAGLLLLAIASVFVFLYFKASKKVEPKSIN